MKKKELKKLSIKELNQKLFEYRERLIKIRIYRFLRTNTRIIRRKIARVLTYIQQK